MRMKNIKKYLNLVTVVVIMSSLVLVGCGNKNTQSQGDSTSVTDESSDSKTGNENLPVVTITVENYGVIQAELYPEIAPNTVNNFISLVKKGFYDNLTFHRIIKGFMIQGGDPKGDGTGGPGYSIEGEFTSNGFANSLKHTKGVLSMARAQDPNSAGSQFFIMTGDAPNLDGQYAAFGKVTSGLDVLEKIQSVKTKSNDAPIDKVVIKSITVDTKGVDYKEPKKK
ncbi:putative peptidyl-prolyl cis-trans isomerase [Clostridium saccharobutylicum]|uniref:peptidylprolyl isomerase n=1 Tax=Clostridium saccharobutylicum TaxID=169679 RepID=UPI000983F07A|nr:peptidylprolyl isomerase [Clostridium saccharobutylicum]AQS11821.1 putative peptidyl-prolyl cis-trans isomerase [Clostridium saccharobutylicum]NSB86924.1 peptidyl-prolyl cis-trans isomerase B (cyclophilin B) [Clostridium saccharobutylicum]NYC30173.1 peptidyl-prolyl cis-trans isomerase B (cyclophilin B) [Clostridium saccharobutylicum]OOM12740.1 putative peptidyl-prolyl cis-trans isomerase [Clostridium saccharobutylicum]